MTDETGRCACPPCPGRGHDGHGMLHCAECCFGTGVDADLDCPTHGDPAYSAPTPPTTVQADRDAGQVRLTFTERRQIRLACLDTVLGPGDAALIEVERILAARQSDPDATEREALAEAWDEGFDAGERDVFEHERTTFDAPCIANPYRRTVTTGEWTEVGE